MARKTNRILNDIPVNTKEQLQMFELAMPKPEEEQITEGLQPIKQPIDQAAIRTAQETLQKYKAGKANLDKKLIENEQWWKLKHHRQPEAYQEQKAKPVSAWMFNALMNKHADAMDNYPEPSVLPREESDSDVAHTLSSIIPVVLENCEFEQTYSSAWWDKLKNGSCVYGVFWNPKKQNGLGDIDIRMIDILSMYWEPGVQRLEDSQNIFVLTLMDNKILKSQYPQLEGKLNSTGVDKEEYRYDDSVDTSDKSVVVDWYYRVNYGSGDILHYVKFCGDEILFASENEPEYQQTGFYADGRYPFVMDVLFEEKGTPAGYGFVDVMKSPQEYIDQMSAAIIDNTKWAAKPRFFGKDSAGINEEEFMDLSKPIVHVTGSPNDDNVKQIQIGYMSSTYLAVLQDKVAELKETSGNRDFSQGATTSGVTAASAVSMLIETGSKGSRDMIKGSYRAFASICNLIIERIRQFYDEPRTFRITGKTGNVQFTQFDNAALQAQSTNEFGLELKGKQPVFDIKVKAQKANPYSQISQNELALQFYSLGLFNPQLADQAMATIDMMEFEGKEKVEERISQNGTMYQQLQQMQNTMLQMADALAQATGDTRVLDALQQQGMVGTQPVPQGGSSKLTKTDSMGQPVSTNNTVGSKAKEKARTATEVR